MKKCSKCLVYKDISEFHTNKAKKDGHTPDCKICRKAYNKLRYAREADRFRKEKREYYREKTEWPFYERSKQKPKISKTTLNNRRNQFLQRMYGINTEVYEELYYDQRGGCAICGAVPSGRRKYLDVDHDHQTGEIRGLLCSSCNILVGCLERRFQGYKFMLENISKYLASPPGSLAFTLWSEEENRKKEYRKGLIVDGRKRTQPKY